MKEREEIATSSQPKENNTSSTKTELPNLLSELEKIKNEGNALYKEKKIDDAKSKFTQGIKLFDDNYSLINKESQTNSEIFFLHKKILSNLALCYYIQGMYKDAIFYDLKLISHYPKFGKSFVRLIKSYSKINKIQQSVKFGEFFLELDQEIQDKFKGIKEFIKNENIKLNKMQKEEDEKNKKKLIKFILPALVLFLAVVFFLLRRKK